MIWAGERWGDAGASSCDDAAPRRVRDERRGESPRITEDSPKDGNEPKPMKRNPIFFYTKLSSRIITFASMQLSLKDNAMRVVRAQQHVTARD